MHLTITAALVLLHTAAAWGPQDKNTKLPRLWLPTTTPVIAGETAWPLDAAQRRKLGKVLRLRRGDELRVFDSGMGEWLASFEDDCVIAKEQTREATPSTHLELFFAPIKKKRTSLLIEKAVELGATSLRPVGTRVRMSRAGGVRTASTPSTRRLLAVRRRGCRPPRHRRDSPRR